MLNVSESLIPLCIKVIPPIALRMVTVHNFSCQWHVHEPMYVQNTEGFLKYWSARNM